MELWMFVVGALLSACGFMCVFILNSIKENIKKIEVSVSALEKDMRGDLSKLERRVTVVETRCEGNHTIAAHT